jgi:uncharacterized Ntn-hydrolase superfamily protein
MADVKRVSIGFGGGQVAAVRLGESELERLRKGLGDGDGWLDLTSDDGDFSLDLGQVVFVKVEGSAAAIGFSDT